MTPQQMDPSAYARPTQTTPDGTFAPPPPPPPPPPRRGGVQAVVAAGTAIAGLVLVVNPESAVARAVASALPVLGDALPVVITACGTIIAAFSSPPKLKRPTTR